jgi:DNA repair protein RadC
VNLSKILKLYQKIENDGVRSLSTSDLMFILLSMHSFVDTESLPDFDLRNLLYLSFKQLKDQTGLDDSVIFKLMAALEFSNRVFQENHLRFGQINSSKKAGDVALSFFQNKYQEYLLGFFMDVNKKLIRTEIIFKGTLNASIACPRDIFACALKYNAHSFILVHNHPSGDCNASKEDLRFTKKMVKASRIMGIEFTDHLIIGANRYLSLREEQLFK